MIAGYEDFMKDFEDFFRRALRRNEDLAKVNYFLYSPEDLISGLEGKEREVLLKVAVEGMKTGYDLHSGRGSIISSSTWHYTRSSLVDNGLIELKKEEPFRTQKRKRKMYGPTFKGLVVAIQGLARDEEKEKVRKVAENWGHMIPSVLDKWDLFVKEDLEDETFNALCGTAFWFYKINTSDEEKNEEPAFSFARQFYEKILDDYLFFSPSPLSLYLPKDISLKYRNEIEQKRKESREKWLECFLKDTKIKELVKNLLEEKESQFKNDLEEIQSFNTKITSL